MQAVGVQVYLVNIGWNGIGKCILIKDICVIIDVIFNGLLDNVEIFILLMFNLVILIELLGVDMKIFDLCNIYVFLEQWQEKVEILVKLFIDNFDKYIDIFVGVVLVAVGLKL